MKKLIVLVILVGAGAAGGWWWWKNRGTEATEYRMGKAERGEILVTVTATGAVQPVTQVQVGTQVSGVVSELHADFNSKVKAGQLLAKIDPAPFLARVAQDRANLARAEADVGRVEAGLAQAVRDLARSRDMAAQGIVPASELDAAIAAHDSLVAQHKVAKAGVDQAKATLSSSEVSLQYTSIFSPIDGIVISRSVDVGQTVAASLAAPTLYVIAENLRKIQVQASVAEADIGRIFSGQPVSFTVDAFREMTFKGKVSQVRLLPITVQNVVTYTVIVEADNPEEKLLPGMTATVAFEVARRPDVLKVPNAALRFTPPETTPEGAAAAQSGGGRRPGGGGGRGKAASGQVWIKDAATLKPLKVSTGLSDGSFTEILEGELKEGQELVVGTVTAGAAQPAMNNPFSSGGSRGGGGRGGR